MDFESFQITVYNTTPIKQIILWQSPYGEGGNKWTDTGVWNFMIS